MIPNTFDDFRNVLNIGDKHRNQVIETVIYHNQNPSQFHSIIPDDEQVQKSSNSNSNTPSSKNLLKFLFRIQDRQNPEIQ
jgi:hypothetical protein